MEDLITALLIIEKYLKEDVYSPTHCEHDTLYITCIEYADINEEDQKTLKALGFCMDKENGGLKSYRFGSS